ncbi:hypothetical protein NDR87_11805 [Nocardia sp. CDC159]|uniref:Uncharacterized protein n=1 Tax=Nocardia pulmonis TaxID=2951408 RepID=A0A9X2IWC5_9NOCA|nr:MULTISPECIES: hypothetical protein [Nocardia]MCM6774158.1 hypothetical protein [Nocardia pulmonis]MCM6787045.1 hypothetical protein [Nocardia sp. CDC159]
MATEHARHCRTLECAALLFLLVQLSGSIAVQMGALGGPVGVSVGWGVPAWIACGCGLRVAALSRTSWSPLPRRRPRPRAALRVRATALAAVTALVTACAAEAHEITVVPIADHTARTLGDQ